MGQFGGEVELSGGGGGGGEASPAPPSLDETLNAMDTDVLWSLYTPLLRPVASIAQQVNPASQQQWRSAESILSTGSTNLLPSSALYVKNPDIGQMDGIFAITPEYYDLLLGSGQL